MNDYQLLKGKVKNAKYVDFGNVLSNSFALFKKVWLKGFLLIIIVVILSLAISFVLHNMGFSSELIGYTFDDFSDFLNIYRSQLIYSVPQALLTSVISFPLLAGFYKTCKEIDVNETETDYLFYYFKGDYVLKIILLSVIYTVIALGAQVLFLIPYIYAYIPLSYFIVIFAFNPELSVGEIIELSFIFGTKKWFVTFGSIFIMMLLAMLGIIACCIGILFTVSIVYLPMYFIYKEGVGFDEVS